MQLQPEQAAPRMQWAVRVPMRDGVELSADVYFPPSGEGPWPVILQRTPYDNTAALWVNIAVHFARQGYAFVSQDVRGRADSDGEWEPFVNEGPDGYDTIEWIAAQPWCDGQVGMMGGSYCGFVQWVAAKERAPHVCMLRRCHRTGYVRSPTTTVCPSPTARATPRSGPVPARRSCRRAAAPRCAGMTGYRGRPVPLPAHAPASKC